MRVGILGGTLDPVHLGHLLLAEQASEALALDRMLLVPASRPPHKLDGPRTPYAHRLRMVELAVAGAPHLIASDLERDATRPSYTVETLARVRGTLAPADEIYLLLGSDSLRDLPTWREPERIAGLARLAVYPRPEERVATSALEAEVVRDLRADVVWLDGPRLQLSATEVRARVRAGRSIRFLVPESVRAYIVEQGLYRDPEAGLG